MFSVFIGHCLTYSLCADLLPFTLLFLLNLVLAALGYFGLVQVLMAVLGPYHT